MTRLAQLRARLSRLRRRRQLVRQAIGLSAMALALLWVLLAVFLVDWLLAYLGGPRWEMTRPQRVVVLLVAFAGFVWAVRRYAVPWFGHRESLVDMALLVQRQHKIDTDLVAAIEFEAPEATQWGSVQLEQAVIDTVAHFGTSLRMLVDLPTEKLRWRLAALCLTAAAVVVGVLQFPDHVRIFANRLAMGSAHYPTRTTIASLSINGQPVTLTAWGHPVVKSHYGKPVRFELTCGGELPSEGEARLKTETGGLQTSIPLSSGEKPELFSGELDRLVDAATCQFYVGDAWTEPVRLVVVPPAAVDVELDVTPPGYASGKAVTETISGLRQASVAEGSQVVVRAIADKELQEATVTIDEKPYKLARQGRKPAEGETDIWVLDPKETPLAAVAEPIRYVVQVTDADGLQLERPIEGVIRIKVDHPPQIYGTAVTQIVLPTAQPTIRYNAADDYGLKQVTVLAEVVKPDALGGFENGSEPKAAEPQPLAVSIVSQSESSVEPPDASSLNVVYDLKKDDTLRKSVQNGVRLNLAPLGAQKGDQVKIYLKAVDFRGAGLEGRAALSEPLVFQVTDERGIYAAMAEADRESYRQLQTMIEQQIGVGEER